jgi:hypothetical protein
MKKRIYVRSIHVLLVLALISLLFAGCGNSTDRTKHSKPPQIPPESTFVMDFDDFTQSKSSSNSNQTSEALLVSLFSDSLLTDTIPNALGDRSNWSFAALNIGFWNLVGAIGLAIPVAAFIESIKQTPTKQSDDLWIWTYSITVGGITYTAELHGKYINSGVRWDMYVTKQNEYTDYLWYYGESNLENTKGFWVLKDKPSKPNDLLRIDWHRNITNQTGDIKYTNIVPGGTENGGYISFNVFKDEPYNRSYTIYNRSKNGTTYIEWNSTTKNGRVKDSLHFGDSNWRCWDSNLNNAECP